MAKSALEQKTTKLREEYLLKILASEDKKLSDKRIYIFNLFCEYVGLNAKEVKDLSEKDFVDRVSQGYFDKNPKLKKTAANYANISTETKFDNLNVFFTTWVRKNADEIYNGMEETFNKTDKKRQRKELDQYIDEVIQNKGDTDMTDNNENDEFDKFFERRRAFDYPDKKQKYIDDVAEWNKNNPDKEQIHVEFRDGKDTPHYFHNKGTAQAPVIEILPKDVEDKFIETLRAKNLQYKADAQAEFRDKKYDKLLADKAAGNPVFKKFLDSVGIVGIETAEQYDVIINGFEREQSSRTQSEENRGTLRLEEDTQLHLREENTESGRTENWTDIAEREAKKKSDEQQIKYDTVEKTPDHIKYTTDGTSAEMPNKNTLIAQKGSLKAAIAQLTAAKAIGNTKVDFSAEMSPEFRATYMHACRMVGLEMTNLPELESLKDKDNPELKQEYEAYERLRNRRTTQEGQTQPQPNQQQTQPNQQQTEPDITVNEPTSRTPSPTPTQPRPTPGRDGR